jgi:hypothetical protein
MFDESHSLHLGTSLGLCDMLDTRHKPQDLISLVLKFEQHCLLSVEAIETLGNILDVEHK